jgi:hypothetical protein
MLEPESYVLTAIRAIRALARGESKAEGALGQVEQRDDDCTQTDPDDLPSRRMTLLRIKIGNAQTPIV